MAQRRTSPPGAHPRQAKPMTFPFEAFIPVTRERKVYILKGSGLKVLRAANSFMTMRTFGKYQEVFLERDEFRRLKRDISAERQANIAETRAILAAKRRL